jgi:hypothetical protein
MTPDFESFAAACLPFPGLVAWSARQADGTMAKQCYTGWLAPSQVEQVLGPLLVAVDSLAGQSGQPVRPLRQCWVFEHLRVHLALRDDGTCLALFVENRPGLPGAAAESVLAEFQKAGARR